MNEIRETLLNLDETIDRQNQQVIDAILSSAIMRSDNDDQIIKENVIKLEKLVSEKNRIITALSDALSKQPNPESWQKLTQYFHECNVGVNNSELIPDQVEQIVKNMHKISLQKFSNSSANVTDNKSKESEESKTNVDQVIIIPPGSAADASTSALAGSFVEKSADDTDEPSHSAECQTRPTWDSQELDYSDSESGLTKNTVLDKNAPIEDDISLDVDATTNAPSDDPETEGRFQRAKHITKQIFLVQREDSDADRENEFLVSDSEAIKTDAPSIDPETEGRLQRAKHITGQVQREDASSENEPFVNDSETTKTDVPSADPEPEGRLEITKHVAKRIFQVQREEKENSNLSFLELKQAPSLSSSITSKVLEIAVNMQQSSAKLVDYLNQLEAELSSGPGLDLAVELKQNAAIDGERALRIETALEDSLVCEERPRSNKDPLDNYEYIGDDLNAVQQWDIEPVEQKLEDFRNDLTEDSKPDSAESSTSSSDSAFNNAYKLLEETVSDMNDYNNDVATFRVDLELLKNYILRLKEKAVSENLDSTQRSSIKFPQAIDSLSIESPRSLHPEVEPGTLFMRPLGPDFISLRWRQPEVDVVGYQIRVNGVLHQRVRNPRRNSAVLKGLQRVGVVTIVADTAHGSQVIVAEDTI